MKTPLTSGGPGPIQDFRREGGRGEGGGGGGSSVQFKNNVTLSNGNVSNIRSWTLYIRMLEHHMFSPLNEVRGSQAHKRGFAWGGGGGVQGSRSVLEVDYTVTDEADYTYSV